ncbi:MAG: SGNH/GDSL hydrolase family protein [Planctomycetota bacterium]
MLVPLHPEGWFVYGPSDDRYYVPRPGLRYRMGEDWFEHSALGAPQGRDVRPEARGRRRVAFVGDSVCYGLFAAGERNVCRRVQAALGEPWEALNFGVPGYNAHMVAATLREQVLRFEGLEAVVYLFHENDLINATFSGAYLHRPSVFRERYDLPAPTWKRLLRRSIFLSWTRDRLQPAPPPAPPEAGHQPPRAASAHALLLHELLERDTPHRGWFLSHLRDMRDRCRAAGLPFALLYVPLEDTLYLDERGRYRDTLEALCRGEGVTFLDGLEALRPARGERLYGDSAHPDGRGHELLARPALAWLRGVTR